MLLSGFPPKWPPLKQCPFKTESAGWFKGTRRMVIATICPPSPSIGTTGDGRTFEPGYLQHEQKARMVLSFGLNLILLYSTVVLPGHILPSIKTV